MKVGDLMPLVDKIYARWRVILFRLCVIFAATGTLVEIVIYLVDSSRTKLFLAENLYRFRFIYLPSSLNLIVILISGYCIHSKRISSTMKNAWCCILIYFLCANTHVIHYVYASLLPLPVIAIFISTFFANRILTLCLTIASCCSLAIAAFMGAIELRKGDPQLSSDVGLAYLFIILTYTASNLLITFIREQLQALSESSKQEHKLIEELQLDIMMGIFNRKALFSHIGKLVPRLSTQPDLDDENAYALLILDIDNFKTVNDTYGHLNGDTVLLRLAKVLRMEENERVRSYRYGGEEIVVLFNKLPRNEIEESVNNLTQQFQQQRYEFAPELAITLSGGLAYWDKKFSTVNQWIQTADDALYCAKANGKNKIEKRG